MSVTSRLARVQKGLKAIAARHRFAQEHGAGALPAQLRDIYRYRRLFGTSEFDYYDYALYRPQMTDAERGTFLGAKRGFAIQQVLNPVSSWRAVKDKVVFADLMQRAGIPTPEVLGVIDVAKGPDGLRQVVDELERTSAARIADGFVVKPAAGSNIGRGVLVFRDLARAADGQPRLRLVSGVEMTLDEMFATLSEGIVGWDQRPRHIARYLVQPRLTSHETLRAYNPKALGTLRVVTLVTPSDVEILGASYKMGVGAKGTDNYNDGGVAIALDVATGTLQRGYRKGDDTEYTAHPETGLPFSGMALPHASGALDLARRAAGALPSLRTLGWDVALTATGPCIIEANPDWAIDLIQRPQRRGIWREPLTSIFKQLG